MTYHDLNKSRKLKGLAFVMLCNGILYFIVLSILNVGLLILTVGFSVVPDGLFFHIWFYTFPLSSVLVSHFLLDLQEEHQRTASGLTTDTSSDASQDVGSSLQFAGALGSIGSLIGLAADDTQEGEGDDGGSDGPSAATEDVCPDERQPNPESPIGEELEITEVQDVEDEFTTVEVLRVGGGKKSI